MSFNYPIGKAEPPPSGGGGTGPGWGPPGGAPAGWAPPSNAWGGSGGWAPPSGAWAAPSGTWASGGGGGYAGGYPPSGPVYPSSSPDNFLPQPSHPVYQPCPYPNQPSYHGAGSSVYPPPPVMGNAYTPGPYHQDSSMYPSHGENVYPLKSIPYHPTHQNAFHLYPGYSPYPGNQQPYSPDAPQLAPNLSSGSSDAIEYFKEMCDKDVIPDEGRTHFLTLAGVDGAIDAFELEGILNKVFLSEFKFNGFSSDMTRSLVAMRDYDISGKLGFEDFRRLWTDLAWCKRAFVMLDVNKSGAFCKTEFEKALETMGLTVTPKVHQALIMRYADKEGTIRFDDFVLCYIRLKTMMTTYQDKDPQNSGTSEFERDEFVQLAIYS